MGIIERSQKPQEAINRIIGENSIRVSCFYCEGTGEDYDEPILDCEHCSGTGYRLIYSTENIES